MCELYCSIKHFEECNPSKSAIKITKLDELCINVPIVCSHCEKAFCMAVCPTKALKRDAKTGAILLDESICVKCRACLAACPFGAITMDREGELIKCDLCEGDPSCVKHCETEAIKFVRADRASQRRRILTSRRFAASYLTEQKWG